MLKKINPKYHDFLIVIGFVLIFKIIRTVFYGSYFSFFNNLAPKWDRLVQNRFGLDLYFLELKPYLDFSFFLSSFKSPTTYLGVAVFAYLFWQRKKISWKALSANGFLRFFFLVPGLLLCWEMLTYDYNYYLDNFFLLERVLMLGFLILIWFHPMYSVWFLIIAFLFRAQFDFPIGGFPLFDKKILFDIYVLLISFLLMCTQLKLPKKWLPYLLLILVASGYFASGLGKLRFTPGGYEWLFHDPLNYLVLNGIERGWTLSVYWVKWITEYAIFFKLLVLAVELFSISLLYKRKGAIFLLSGAIALHLGILFVGGIFFWKWITVDFLLLGYLIYDKSAKKIFNPMFFKCSLVVIPFGIFWNNAYTIGWLDTKYNQMFRYSVVLENGKEYQASQSLLDPYHQLFYRGEFLYLVDDKCLKIAEFGYTFNYKLARAINSSNINSIEDVVDKFGVDLYNRELEKKHIEFLKTFFHNYNKHIDDTYWRKYLKAPEHIYNFVPEPRYNGQGIIKRLKIYMKTTYIEEGKIKLLEKKLVKSIEIP